MISRLNPYISFRDNTREAMEFYNTVFGGKLELHTFKEYHASQDPSEDDKIMHSMIETENGITFMAADTPKSMEYNPGKNMKMLLGGDNEAELRNYWDKLTVGATIHQQLNKAPWGDTFGMFTDKYGIEWMVNISGKKM